MFASLVFLTVSSSFFFLFSFCRTEECLAVACEEATKVLLAYNVPRDMQELQLGLSSGAEWIERVAGTSDMYLLGYASLQDSISAKSKPINVAGVELQSVFSPLSKQPEAVQDDVLSAEPELSANRISILDEQKESITMDSFYQDLKKESKNVKMTTLEAERGAPGVLNGTSCVMCEKRFKTLEELDKHCRISVLHKQNMGIQESALSASEKNSFVRRAGAGLGAEKALQSAPKAPTHTSAGSYRKHVYAASLSRFNRDE